MTGLEDRLASILDAIERARAARDALALVSLLQRKDAICAVLAAPEQSWCEPPDRSGSYISQHAAANEEALVA